MDDQKETSKQHISLNKSSDRVTEFVGGMCSVALGVVLSALEGSGCLKSKASANSIIASCLSVAANSLAGALIGGGALLIVDPSKSNWKEKSYKGIIAGGLVGGMYK